MSSRSRQPLVALLGALIPVVLVLGIFWGGHPNALPRFARDALVNDDEARVYDQALGIITSDYYRPVSRSQLLDDSLAGAVARLHDRFSRYFDPKTYRSFQQETRGEFSGVGINVSAERRGLRVVGVFKGAPAARAGLRHGDLIVAVNGRSLAGLSSDASTHLIQGKPGTTVRLTWLRDGRRESATVRRAKIDVPVVATRVRRVASRPYGQVTLETFNQSGVHGKLRAAIDRTLKAGARGVVLDLRDNPGGLLDEAVLVSSIFIRDGTIVSTRGRARPERTYRAAGDSISDKVPVVVLVNRGTASAAEIVAGALQDRHRAKVVGTNTFGKGVFQEVQQLSNGGALDLTVGEYFLPSGRNLGGGGVKEGKGIRPDVAARDDPGTRPDEALDAALKTLAGERR
jgi:carboxyl-terminal processing protease